MASAGLKQPASHPIPDPTNGRQVFEQICARCHNLPLERRGTGPSLLGVRSRVPGGDWIYRWIKDSGKLIAEGDPYAIKIWKENNKGVMDPFPDLSRETIDDILAWIDGTVPNDGAPTTR